MKYKLERKSIDGIIYDYSDTIASSLNLVIYGGAVGLACAKIHSFDFVKKLPNADIWMFSTMFAVACGAYYIAKNIYKNFQEEKERIADFYQAIEDEKEQQRIFKEEGILTVEQIEQLRWQKEMDRGKTVIDFQTYKDIYDGKTNQESSDDNTRGKRKSLSTKRFFDYEDYDF